MMYTAADCAAMLADATGRLCPDCGTTEARVIDLPDRGQTHVFIEHDPGCPQMSERNRKARRAMRRGGRR